MAQSFTRRKALKESHGGLAGVVVLLSCAVVLGIASPLNQIPQTGMTDSAGTTPQKPPIPLSQLGVGAGAKYRGDGLAVVPKAQGARLRCIFQRLEGEA